MDIQERFSVVLKVSKVVKWSRIFVRSIRGLPNFLAIPIMNPLMRVHDINTCTQARATISRMVLVPPTLPSTVPEHISK